MRTVQLRRKNRTHGSAASLLVLALIQLNALSAFGESTAVLPRKTRTVLLRHVTASVPMRWNSSGGAEGWGLSRTLDVRTVAEFFEPARELIAQVQEVDPELAKTIDFGTLHLNAEIDVRAEALAFGVGLGHETMIVAHTSFWSARTRVSGRFDSSPSLKEAARKLRSEAAKSTDADRARVIAQVLERLPAVEGANLQDVLVSSYGYHPIGSWSGSGIGDTQIFVHKRFSGESNFKNAMRVGTILATGRKNDPNRLTDIPFGLGHSALYGEWLGDLFISGDRLVLSGAARYQYGFAHQREMRLIDDSFLPLSARKENLRVEPGGRWTARMVADARLYKDFRGYTQLSREARSADRLKGSDPSFDYGRLGRDYAAVTDTWEAGLKYSTVPAYQAGRADIPFDISASYSRVIGGKNTEMIEMAFADLQFYF